MCLTGSQHASQLGQRDGNAFTMITSFQTGEEILAWAYLWAKGEFVRIHKTPEEKDQSQAGCFPHQKTRGDRAGKAIPSYLWASRSAGGKDERVVTGPSTWLHLWILP